MRLPRSTLLAAAALGAVGVYWFWRQWWMGSSRPDFEILLRAAGRLSSGEAVYLLSEHAEHTKAPGLTWLMQGFLLMPPGLAKAVWDAGAWASLLWLARLSGIGFSAGVLGWLLAAGPWWAEMRLGQYNILLAALALGVPLWEAKSPSRGKSLVLGAVCVLSMLLKPTQLLLLPFMLSAVVTEGRWRWTLAGAMGFGLLVMGGYSLQLGWEGWVAAHREWLAFLPLSEAKHLMRSDNLGLPTQLARAFGEAVPMPLFSKLLLGAGLGGTIASLLRCGALSRIAFIDALLLSIVCSPMAWRQNFSPLFLVLSWSVLQSKTLSSGRKALVVAFTLAFGLLASDLLGTAGAETFNHSGGPLWLALGAWVLAREKRGSRSRAAQ